MRITLLSPNYYPEDTAIGLYNTDLAKFLSQNGCHISVITGVPYYPQWKIREDYKDKPLFFKEKSKEVTILRYKFYIPSNPTFLKRIFHIISFTFGAIINLFKLRADPPQVIFIVIPFTSSVVVGLIYKVFYGSKIWIHVQDFELDAALQTGLRNKANIFFSLLFKFEKWLFSKANIVSTISQSMLIKLQTKTKSNTYFFPNWIDKEMINPETAKQHGYLLSSKIKILYSGNIGAKQDWEVFLKFCSDLDKKKYKVVIVGDGAKRKWLQEKIKELDLSIASYHQPVIYEDLSNLLCSADLHILFQKTNVIDTVMPSKVLGMMASSKPSLIIGNKNSEVKTIFNKSKGGLYFNKYSLNIVEEIDSLFENPQRVEEVGKNARSFVIENFSKDKILCGVLDQLNRLNI